MLIFTHYTPIYYPTSNHIYIVVAQDSAASKSTGADSLLGVGEMLLLLSLTCDGLTGAVQVWPRRIRISRKLLGFKEDHLRPERNLLRDLALLGSWGTRHRILV